MGSIVRKIESIELSLNQRQIQLRQSGFTKKGRFHTRHPEEILF